jgi:hypothetical protein
MQLYEVWFQLHFSNVVDIGRALVCAQDQTRAKETVIGGLDLQASALTQCDVKRVKPNLFLLERKEVLKPVSHILNEESERPATQKGLRAIANQLGENSEYRREMTEYIAQQRWAMEFSGKADEMEFECRILARIKACDEDTALRRLAGALRERSFGIKDESRYVRQVSIDLMPEIEERI